MLVLRIYGIPTIPPGGATHDKALLKLTSRLQIATGSVLKVLPKKVLVFYPADMLNYGPRKGLVCLVNGIHNGTDQDGVFDHELLMAIADVVSVFVKSYLSGCDIVVAQDEQSGASVLWERP
jgi:hypothetical protein